ncbi:MAG: alpha/beta hydrolase [Acidimicrobiia bacterium]|nr:alpha/beta hydrolase [Acidimicrobiia bacterium]
MADIVLLVHGFATSARRTWQEPGWLDLITEAGRSVIAPDLLGHGEADKPHDPEAYARVEQLVADRLPQTAKVDAIGYSAGARLLLALALENQDRFDRLVIGGLGGRLFERREGNPLLDALEGDDGSDRGDLIAQRFKTMASADGNDPKALAAFARREQPRIDPEHLAVITVPVLIVIGDQDFAGPGEPLAQTLPNAELVTLRGVDHFGLPKSFDFMDRAFSFLGIDPMGN